MRVRHPETALTSPPLRHPETAPISPPFVIPNLFRDNAQPWLVILKQVQDDEYQRLNHILCPDMGIESGFVNQSGCQRRFAQGGSVAMRLFGDLGGIVIADDRRERGDEHE